MRGTADVPLEEIVDVHAAQFAGNGFEPALRHADARLAVAVPAFAHDVIERALALGQASYREIQRAGDERAFRVIADDEVR